MNPYASFFLRPEKDWPTIMKHEHFMVEHRDPELFGLTDPLISNHVPLS